MRQFFLQRSYLSVVLFFFAVSLFACHRMPPQQNVAIDDMHAMLAHASAVDRSIARREKNVRIPSHVSAALIPQRTFAPQVHRDPQRFNVAVQEVPAKAFFTGLMKGTSYNVVVSPDVQGVITLNLKSVTLDEVLQTVHRLYGYDIHRSSAGYEIMPARLHTKVFTLNFLNMSRSGDTQTSVSGGQPTILAAANSNNSNSGFNTNNNNNLNNNTSGSNNTAQTQGAMSSVVKTKSESAFWKTVEDTLNDIVGDKDGRSVVIHPDAGTIVVRADPTQIRQINTYLNTLQSRMNRQVILEAKILEVQLNDRFQSGINWQALGFQQGAAITRDATGALTATSQDFSDNIFTLKSTAGGAFKSMINLLSEAGNVQVLSSPRISTMNNQKAVIKVGADEYFVTGLTTNTVTQPNTTNNLQNINMIPFFSGIALDVMPEIDEKGNVILHIHPSVSQVTQKDKKVTVGGQTVNLPSAQSTIRESDSIVRAASGQVVVIGGLMQNNTAETLRGTPYLGDLPFVGTLFRDTKQTSTKSELVILLRPIVVGPKTWYSQMDEEEESFQRLDRDFHVSNRPDVFGNLAERAPAWQTRAPCPNEEG